MGFISIFFLQCIDLVWNTLYIFGKQIALFLMYSKLNLEKQFFCVCLDFELKITIEFFLDKCTYRPKHYNWIPNIPKEPIITYPFTKECYNNSIINPNIFSIGQLKYLREQFAIGTISYWTTKSLLEFFKWLHFISHKIRFFVAHYSVTIT